MSETNDVFKQLSAFFYADELEWKPQAFNNKDRKLATKALAVTYVEARAIMNRLDEVVGPMNWRDEYAAGPDGGVLCGLSLRIGGEWITKWDGAENTAVEAIKGGVSNALKRAAVKWGIGRYLYGVPSKWVDLDEHQRFKTTPTMPRNFLPADADANGNRPVPGKQQAPVEQTKSAPSQAPKPAPAQAEKPSARTAQVTDEQQTKPKAPKVADVAPTDTEVAWAKRVVVLDNIGVPMKGKMLGDVLENKTMRAPIIAYLAGKGSNTAGNYFTPADEAQEMLQKAAKFLYPQVASEHKKK